MGVVVDAEYEGEAIAGAVDGEVAVVVGFEGFGAVEAAGEGEGVGAGGFGNRLKNLCCTR